MKINTYLVTNCSTGEKRLIEASNYAKAVRLANDRIIVSIVKQTVVDSLVESGMTVERLTDNKNQK